MTQGVAMIYRVISFSMLQQGSAQEIKSPLKRLMLMFDMIELIHIT